MNGRFGLSPLAYLSLVVLLVALAAVFMASSTTVQTIGLCVAVADLLLVVIGVFSNAFSGLAQLSFFGRASIGRMDRPDPAPEYIAEAAQAPESSWAAERQRYLNKQREQGNR